MSMPNTLSDPEKHLQEVLEREVNFRLQAIQDARTASATIKRLEQELEDTRQELGRRNTYIHELHLGQKSEQVRREELIEELVEFSRRLKRAEDRVADLERKAQSWSEVFAVLGRASKALLSGGASRKKATPSVLEGDFTYYLYTSPYRIHRNPRTKLRGWCYSRDGRRITAVRVRIDDLEFQGVCGLEEPEVLKAHPTLSPEVRPGFEVEFSLLPGRQMLSLEVCLDHREWRSVLLAPIWAQIP